MYLIIGPDKAVGCKHNAFEKPSDVSDMHLDVSDMHLDVSDMHLDVSDIHLDVSDIHLDVSDIHLDVSDIHLKNCFKVHMHIICISQYGQRICGQGNH